MTLEELGYNVELENYRKDHNLDSFAVGRVISEHKERYIVKNTEKEYEAEIIGNLRFSAHNRSDFPAVGDWVAISEYDDDKVLIHKVFPRKTIIERQAVGKQDDKQIIATNIDSAFILQAVDRDFSINRIERYLTISNKSNVKPIIILNKIDLVNDVELIKLITPIRERIIEVPIFAISNKSQEGIDKLKEIIENGKTYCLLGSSGVGKSTLLNNLLGKQLMRTSAISISSSRGKHVTSHRELQVLENGGILIDNPGMREIGIADSTDGLETTFETIVELSKNCRFNDCTHTSEIDCAVVAAIERGDINKLSYENYLKMVREKDHYESTIAERRKKDKDFGKMVKKYVKNKKQTR
ncbi:MAG: ribosome small subunit-dependent GTPase A [Bacteroidetes bacterium]|jgi:ribosome biogenesis GTPase / thiamine phosphate phosphatase|nr:ribosome small subunit-dependent GTPase A [Bacteroidota bacterium]MBT3749482.1 ribosome small subunit-dependent GTPase A [Bacteroidota bacterium]MBT4401222.1 ribosome small subunit-dependent GTPase A [Bacteroidota bacterium]MBT4411476.1 ribosome small subunit-dependent GTPase A [Bacteroidota bacterium]MBT5426918.1 ribosome small subunit-dependent GTPase A [Bacteroidota bacterium]